MSASEEQLLAPLSRPLPDAGRGVRPFLSQGGLGLTGAEDFCCVLKYKSRAVEPLPQRWERGTG